MSTWIKSITVLALVLTLGLHWALLQTVAWTGMVINYSQANPFPEAVSMTFDGEHPCRLCKVIKQGRTEEQRQEGLTRAEHHLGREQKKRGSEKGRTFHERRALGE